jgi:outer membrane protein assembly factor BamD
MKSIRSALAALGLLLAMTSCGDYNQVLKSTDNEFKLNKSIEYYNSKKYNQAFALLDELLTTYRGTSKAQDVYLYYCKTLYAQRDYILAQYHYKQFSKTFPRHPEANEAAYMSAYCMYLDAPSSSLDPAPIYKAMDELQLFINTHAQHPRVPEANEWMDVLRSRLETKSFEIARQYHRTQRYAAAVVAFSNTLAEFPDAPYREEALYLKADAAFRLAENSVDEKKPLRMKEAQTACREAVSLFPEGRFAKELQRVQTKIDAYLQKNS